MGSVVSIRNADSDAYPGLIPAGEYLLKFSRYKILTRFDRGVLELWFSVGDTSSQHFGQRIPRYYSVQVSEKCRSFTARPRSDFVKDYAAVFGARPRFNFAPLSDFDGLSVIGRVDTVKKDHRQRKLSQVLQYSTIRELIRRAE